MYRTIFKLYCLAVMCAEIFWLSPILSLELPSNLALLYSIEKSRSIFWLTVLHENFCGFLAGCENIVADNLFVGFLLLIRRQQEILKYRLQNMVVFCKRISCNAQEAVIIEHKLIKHCIRHHDRIYR